MKVLPSVKQIDTMAASILQKQIIYTTYHGDKHDVEFYSKEEAIVLGSGLTASDLPLSSTGVVLMRLNRLRLKYETIPINYNPETVSTDYDTCDKLF